jgi:hypothetical protein
MSELPGNVDRLLDLAEAVCEKSASPGDLAELDSVLLADGESRRCYMDYCWMHVSLKMEMRAHDAVQKARLEIDIETKTPVSDESDTGQIQTLPSIPPIILDTAIPGTVGFFSSGWPVAYLIATVVCGIGALIGAFSYVSIHEQVVDNSPPAIRDIQLPPQPKVEYVGRITGMVDCQWEGTGDWGLGTWDENPKSEIRNPKSLVALGDTLSLRSGLLEITYNSGAKVILQGPVTYAVESSAGGYLSVGKLTARVEKRGEGRNISKSPNTQIAAPSPLSSLPSPLFAIRTPTATVTDLGTEFGVEVDKLGRTVSHVFRGLVRVQVAAADGKARGDGELLRENQSASVDRNGDGQAVLVVLATKPGKFVHDIPKLTIKRLDLADVVAGGDGFSNKRNRGIDPTTGKVALSQPLPDGVLRGNHKYHRVPTLPFVDGVFMPDGGQGPVQIDSVGHTFDGFDKTDNKAAGHIWAGKPVFVPPEPFPTAFGGVEYASPGHGVLAMHANKGITFDLEAIRRASPGRKLVRFKAMAANTEWSSETGDSVFADIFVLVDGRVCFKRREINAFIGVMPIDIPIGDRDRFLTLATTDGGNGSRCDLIMFGDPVLEVVSYEQP